MTLAGHSVWFGLLAAMVVAGLSGLLFGLVLVEHNMPLVIQLCDRVLVLDAGEFIFDSSAAGARKDKKVIQAYLGSDGYVEA